MVILLLAGSPAFPSDGDPWMDEKLPCSSSRRSPAVLSRVGGFQPPRRPRGFLVSRFLAMVIPAVPAVLSCVGGFQPPLRPRGFLVSRFLAMVIPAV